MPVTLANPGVISAADYAQLKGLTFPEKVQQMLGILRQAPATRTQQQLTGSNFMKWGRHSCLPLCRQTGMSALPTRIMLLPLTQSGPFIWTDAVGSRGEVLFIGSGFPATTTFPTVIIIKPTGEVYRMLPSGSTS